MDVKLEKTGWHRISGKEMKELTRRLRMNRGLDSGGTGDHANGKRQMIMMLSHDPSAEHKIPLVEVDDSEDDRSSGPSQ